MTEVSYALGMVIESIPALAKLSPDERLILAAELWRENAVEGDSQPSQEIVSMLQERMVRYMAEPDAVSSWEDVKKRLLGS